MWATLTAAGFDVVAAVDDARRALAACVALDPDLCVLDVALPGYGIAACQAICEDAPGTVVVLLAANPNDDDLFDALEAGAAGYLERATSPQGLGEALHGALAGQAAVSRSVATRVITEFRHREGRRLA
jgi:DNA-binding NarL/FixJ family response regulator